MNLVGANVNLTDYTTIINDAKAANNTLNSLSLTAKVTPMQIIALAAELKNTSKDINTTIAHTFRSQAYNSANCTATGTVLYWKACPALAAVCNNLYNHFP